MGGVDEVLQTIYCEGILELSAVDLDERTGKVGFELALRDMEVTEKWCSLLWARGIRCRSTALWGWRLGI